MSAPDSGGGALRGTTPTGMGTDPPAEPGAEDGPHSLSTISMHNTAPRISFRIVDSGGRSFATSST